MYADRNSRPIIFVLAVFIFISFSYRPAFAERSSEEIDALVNPIITSIREGKTDKLASLAFSKGKARKYIRKEAIASMDENFGSYLNDIGQFHSSILLIESEIQDVYINRHYVLKCDREPLVLRIGFYKASDRWQVQNITIGESLDEMIKEASEVAIGALSTGTKSGLFSVDTIEHRYSNSRSN